MIITMSNKCDRIIFDHLNKLLNAINIFAWSPSLHLVIQSDRYLRIYKIQ